MPYDPKVHHRKSIRLRKYDYSAPGKYFVTICVQGKTCLFGEVVTDAIELNDYGRMVEDVWKQLPSQFPLVELDQFIVMPNHFHAIAVILDPRDKRVGAGFPRPDAGKGELEETLGGENPPLRTLGDVIRWFKYESTKRINERRGMAGQRIWQRNYYEHVIRSDRSYWRIREYIADNPKNWVKDKLHPTSNWQTNNWKGIIE